MNNMPLTLQVPGVPKSHDCIRGSGVRFIEVTYFFKLSVKQLFFSIICWLRSIFRRNSVYFRYLLKLNGFRKIVLLKDPTRASLLIWPWLNLYIICILMLKGFERDWCNNKEIPHIQRKASGPLKGCFCIELLCKKKQTGSEWNMF